MSATKAPRDQILGHADEADGIEEYDNPLPAWWLGIFYFTIAFAVVYPVWYHALAAGSQAAAYDAEMAAAAELWPTPEPGGVTVAVTPESIAAGEQVYTTNCVPCHGPELLGGIGPDLTDAEWVHGGSLGQITQTITNGVPEKGMLTWGPILGPEKIGQVAAFVKSKSAE